MSQLNNCDQPAWYLYMVRTAKGVLYTGITLDVERRFAEHQEGGVKAAKALKGKGPLTLAYVEKVGSKVAAYKREYAIKKLKKAEKEQLIAVGNPPACQHSS